MPFVEVPCRSCGGTGRARCYGCKNGMQVIPSIRPGLPLMIPHPVCKGTGYISCLSCRGSGRISEWVEEREADPSPSEPAEDVDFSVALLTPILKQRINEALGRNDVTPERKASLEEIRREFVDAESLPPEMRVPRMRQIVEKYSAMFGLGYMSK